MCGDPEWSSNVQQRRDEGANQVCSRSVAYAPAWLHGCGVRNCNPIEKFWSETTLCRKLLKTRSEFCGWEAGILDIGFEGTA